MIDFTKVRSSGLGSLLLFYEKSEKTLGKKTKEKGKKGKAVGETENRRVDNIKKFMTKVGKYKENRRSVWPNNMLSETKPDL